MGWRWGGRAAGGAAAVLALALVVALVAPPTTARAAHFTNTVELDDGAVAAALGLSAEAFPDGADEAVLGRDDAFADSLASGALQGTQRPLLLTGGDALDAAVADELARLEVETVHLLGGEAALSTAVADALAEEGYAVERHAGPSRLETAVAVAEAARPEARRALVARAFGDGDDPTRAFADSIAAGAWGAADGRAVLLTESGQLSTPTADYLEASAIEHVTLVGGSAAISEEVAAEVEALGLGVERVAGPTRVETAAALAAARGINGAGSASGVVLVDGGAADAWAGGFAAAALAAQEGAPVLLTAGEELPEATAQWLEGGDAEVRVVCDATVAEAACTAAAEGLGQLAAGEVSLDSATVPRYGELSGAVRPTEHVTLLRAEGCGRAETEVPFDFDGSFALRVTAEQGECSLRFGVEHSDGHTTARTVTVEVTAPEPATDRPELLEARVAEVGSVAAQVHFVFDLPVRGTGFDPEENRERIARYELIGPMTDEEVFAPLVLAEDEDGEPTEAAEEAVFRRDVDDPTVVIADYARNDFDRATTAVVRPAAAEGIDDLWSIEGSAPLRERSYPAGETREADLVRVDQITSGDLPEGEFQARFVLGDGTDLGGPGDYQVVLADGRVLAGHEVSGSATEHVVRFDVTNVATPDGQPCTPDGSGAAACPSRSAALSSLRRGGVSAAVGGPHQSAPIVGEGRTDAPDLFEVTLDTDDAKATFVFDQPVSASGVEPAGLRLSDVLGGEVLAMDATREGEEAIVAEFPEGSVTRAVTGASVDDAAVGSVEGPNAADAVGIAQTLEPGAVLAPALVGVDTAIVEHRDDARVHEVTLRFDAPVGAIDADAIRLWDAAPSSEGEQAPPEPDVTASSCVTDAEDAAVVRCEATVPNELEVTLVSAAGGAVENQAPVVGGRTFPSYPATGRL